MPAADTLYAGDARLARATIGRGGLIAERRSAHVRSMLRAIARRTGRMPAESAAAPSVAVRPPLRADFVDSSVAELVVGHPKLADNIRILGERLGQIRSITEGRPVDALGQPIPWYTYPAIEYVERLALKGKRIFEFGCGHSTRYWCRRGASVTAVEHSREWFEEVTAFAGGANLLFRDERDSYVAALREAGVSFDVIVIDGVWRTLRGRGDRPGSAPHRHHPRQLGLVSRGRGPVTRRGVS